MFEGLPEPTRIEMELVACQIARAAFRLALASKLERASAIARGENRVLQVRVAYPTFKLQKIELTARGRRDENLGKATSDDVPPALKDLYEAEALNKFFEKPDPNDGPVLSWLCAPSEAKSLGIQHAMMRSVFRQGVNMMDNWIHSQPQLLHRRLREMVGLETESEQPARDSDSGSSGGCPEGVPSSDDEGVGVPPL